MPKPRIEVTEEAVIITEQAYPIELSRVPDFQGLMEWVHHLTEKSWVDTALIRELNQAVCAAKGWELYRGL